MYLKKYKIGRAKGLLGAALKIPRRQILTRGSPVVGACRFVGVDISLNSRRGGLTD